MAYGAQQIKITWLFAITDTDEIAATEVSYTGDGAWAGAGLQLNAIKTDDEGASYLTAMSTLLDEVGWASWSELTAVKIAALDVNGHYITDAYVFEDPDPDTGDKEQVLPQSTLVISLRTDTTLGKGNFGRMYLPHTRPTLTTGTPFYSYQASVATGAAAFLNSVTALVNGSGPDTLYPAIMSQASGTPKREITRVAVGKVTDTQRRRRNRLPEDYAFASLS